MTTYYKIWIISGLVKMALAIFLPLSPDEAYYWVWSQNLELSYYDHPAMVAWLIALGNIFPIDNGLRWPFAVLGHLTILLWRRITASYLSESAQVSFLWLFLLSPLIGLGSIIATPDVPVLFFWSLSLVFFQEILHTNRLRDYFLFGAALGLGFCAKYHIVLIGPALAIFLYISKKWRTLSVRGILFSATAAVIFSLPVLIWNYQNNFSSFSFQLDHGLGKANWQPYWSWSYLLGAVLLLFPPFSLLLLKKSQDLLEILLKCLTSFVAAFFLLTSFRGHVELNWIHVAIPSMLALAAAPSRMAPWRRTHNGLWALLLTIILINHWLIPIPALPDKLKEQEYYSSLVPHHDGESYFSTYQMSSMLWYLTKKPTKKLPEMSRIDYFDRMNNPRPNSDFKLIREKGAMLPLWIAESGFHIDKIDPINNFFEKVYFVR